ncbi:M48 family metalloprotease [Diaphorobacter aerolatus]|uniref:M48 family metalloprotease n=1 Tax=Diaphorobacter aerolatus TaxID=1288495 RepID=A0A7H0GNB8_9BURK|nr:M48 family metalloprotease [Diaphorobacter aerolatus]QNP49784.1 M48 family metalloprotease [Diaphorobacter aerolatus]
MFGGARNELIIGLPILMALDKRRMLAVLAHEYGHLRGDHGKLSSWVYRTRMSWSRLYDSMEDSASPFAVTTQAFLRWYSPRFVARTFAMARQDEYEADRIAAKLLGREEAGASLVETQIKSAWLNTRFWELHWAQAAREPLPLGPFRAMQRILVEAPEPVFAKETLRRAMQQLSSVDDTHPVLRERVKALGGDRASLPQQWSQQGALSLLGKAAAHWVDHFDRAWCKENADEWKRHHARLQRARARVMELQSGGPSRSVAEQVEAADLIRRLNPASSAANGLYQQALDRDPVNADALIGMVQCLMQSDPERAIQYLDRLWSNHPTHRLWAARMAVGELDTPREGREFQEQALKLWRERRREGENTEAEVVQELNRSGLMDSAMRHDLTAFELAELQAEMQRMLPVRQGWVVRRRLASLPDRKVYVVLVTLTRNEDAVQRQWCAELEQRIGLPGMMIVVPTEVAGSKEQWALFAGEPVFVRG